MKNNELVYEFSLETNEIEFISNTCFGQRPYLPGNGESPSTNQELDKEEIQNSLIEKGFAKFQNNTDSILIDPAIQGIIGALVFMDSILIYKGWNEQKTIETNANYYFASGLIVGDNSSGDDQTVSVFRNKEVLVNHLFDVTNEISSDETANVSCKVINAEFAKIPYLIADGGIEEATQILETNGFDSAKTKDFVRSLKSPQSQDTFELYQVESGKLTFNSKATIITGFSGMWIIEQSKEQTTTQIRAITLREIEKQIKRLIDIAIN